MEHCFLIVFFCFTPLICVVYRFMQQMSYVKSCISLSALPSFYPPQPPSLLALQGHLNASSMDEKHSEKPRLHSSTNLPRSAPSSVSKAQLLDGHTEIRMRCLETDNGKIYEACIIGLSVELCVSSSANLQTLTNS